MKNFLKISLAFLLLFSFSFTTLPTKTNTNRIVVIDVGHGGKDTGTSHNILVEKDIVHQIAQKIKALNTNKNVTLHFTRTEDTYVSLQERVAMINELKPDMVLSLHVESLKQQSHSGIRVFYSDKGIQPIASMTLGTQVLEAFKDNELFITHDVRPAPFFILKHSEVPAVLLELGNLSNPVDSKALQSEAQQEEIAKTILSILE